MKQLHMYDELLTCNVHLHVDTIPCLHRLPFVLAHSRRARGSTESHFTTTLSLTCTVTSFQRSPQEPEFQGSNSRFKCTIQYAEMQHALPTHVRVRSPESPGLVELQNSNPRWLAGQHPSPFARQLSSGTPNQPPETSSPALLTPL